MYHLCELCNKTCFNCSDNYTNNTTTLNYFTYLIRIYGMETQNPGYRSLMYPIYILINIQKTYFWDVLFVYSKSIFAPNWLDFENCYLISAINFELKICWMVWIPQCVSDCTCFIIFVLEEWSNIYCRLCCLPLILFYVIIEYIDMSSIV